jgi:acyl-CoA reductase-like NAD-dependent aldehyde dehydrogenase
LALRRTLRANPRKPAIVKACHEAGIVPGAVNMVTGTSSKIAVHLIRSPIVRKVSLTGSTPSESNCFTSAPTA